MLVYYSFIAFVVQSFIVCVYGDNHGVERCKLPGEQWKNGNTTFTALIHKNELYAYPICQGGFILSGAVKVRCVNGWWESPLPQCDRITSQQCDVLPPIASRMLVRNCEDGVPAVGKKCRYRCLSPYKILGSTQRICRKNLQWSGTQPRCIFQTPTTRPRSSFTNVNLSSPRVFNRTENTSNSSQLPANPCFIKNGGCDHKCHFRNGSIRCFCNPGYRAENGTKCQDINECAENTHSCSQICNNTAGSYTCSCSQGYIQEGRYQCKEYRETPFIDGNNQHRNTHPTGSTDPQRREPVNPCEANNGGCDQICDSSLGYIRCLCHDGYRMLRNGICTDIDECLENLHSCRQICQNTVGSYTCSCRQGYIQEGHYECKDIDECAENVHSCRQICQNTVGSYTCSCRPGYFHEGRYECKDIDECQQSNPCDQRCHNSAGSYTCSCEPGYVQKNKHNCEGCRKGSYRPEGDVYCRECPPNSFTDSEAKSSISDCICASGFIGDPSTNEPCKDIDECEVNNFGCSDTCVNTPGSAHCSCPIGFGLQEDNKTCVDIDECKIKNGGCQMFCKNSVGSFSCACSDGYFLSKDGYSCDDADECAKNNGGCSHLCINFPGGFYCSCPKGYRLDVEGKECVAIRCLSVAVPHYSTMRCFSKNYKSDKVIIKPHDDSLSAPEDYAVDTICRIKCNKGYSPSTPHNAVQCLDDGSWNSTTPECKDLHCPLLVAPKNGDIYPEICTEGPISIKQKCYFTCKTGYHLTTNKPMVHCKNNLQWSNNTLPSCEADNIVPVINCPNDITIELKTNENRANVTIPEPETNLENIEVYPDWISANESIEFPSGQTVVLFNASDVRFNATAVCMLTVNVVDKEPPSFLLCPDSMVVDGTGSTGVIVEWEEPYAVDNVGIKSISSNLGPNTRLPAGVHHVEYMATDEAGNAARCSFKINISRGRCGDLDDPANGKANCMSWLVGKLCRPLCDPGYTRDSNEPKFFACGDTGIWTPSEIISPCMPECLNGTIWSPITESCEEADKATMTVQQ